MLPLLADDFPRIKSMV